MFSQLHVKSILSCLIALIQRVFPHGQRTIPRYWINFLKNLYITLLLLNQPHILNWELIYPYTSLRGFLLILTLCLLNMRLSTIIITWISKVFTLLNLYIMRKYVIFISLFNKLVVCSQLFLNHLEWVMFD